MIAILSIKPEYIERIYYGNKRFEFRKNIFREKIERILVYSSRPVKKIVGEIYPGEIIIGSPEYLWKVCGNYSGLTKEEFFSYFHRRVKKGYAIEIKKFIKYHEPVDPYEILPDFKPPQSWLYINDSDYLRIRSRAHLSLF